MVEEVIWGKKFEATFKKIKDKNTKDPETGKPLRYGRQGEREVRVGGFRLIYSYAEDTLILLCFIPHKKL